MLRQEIRWWLLKGNGVKEDFSFSFCSCKIRKKTPAHLYVDGKDLVGRKIDDAEERGLLEKGVGLSYSVKVRGRAHRGTEGRTRCTGSGSGYWGMSMGSFSACFNTFSKVESSSHWFRRRMEE